MFSLSTSEGRQLYHGKVAVEPYDHLALASFPRFHSWFALRMSRSYWAGVSEMVAAMLLGGMILGVWGSMVVTRRGGGRR